MTFDATERAVLARLADVLVPAGEGFPSASEAGVGGAGLDKVLLARPDFAAALKELLAAAKERPAAEFIADAQTKDPARFGLLAELVPAAYFLNPDVRAQLGYRGQDPRPIDPNPDYLESGLLQAVIDRGPIFRPTPGKP
jgi:hypothetical protein